ncbi:MAG TPA: DUF4198 domain-containing protein [Steroidobacteraceae bacterium]|nr:DUF4198 domain-containing protein [Steroidobacteraceae bacterium]
MSTRITGLVLLIGICCTRVAAAHEFWVQPREFWLTPPAALSVTLQVGDSRSRQESPIPPQRITRFAAIGPRGAPVDMRGGSARLDKAGAWLVALETDTGAYSRQSAARFNDYLEAEGLTPALEYRTRTHQMHVDGFERYSRTAKSIVLVGRHNRQAQRHVTQPLGLKLEIVPQVSPYAEPQPVQLPLRVLYEGRPLAGALVKLLNLEQDLTGANQTLTDDAGLASFSMPTRGKWLVSVVWTRRLADDADADYETTFASLTFGFPGEDSGS